jgi:Arc/MetJ-type ribon-helix-helix transcriptional regulator
MALTLTPELQQAVDSLMRLGEYEDAESVIERALRLLAEFEAERELRAKLQHARDQIAAGKSREYDRELYEHIRASAFARFDAGERSQFDASR